jgi:hypothetical protein
VAFVNARFATAAAVIAIALLVARELRHATAVEANIGRPMTTAALVALWLALGVEVHAQFTADVLIALALTWSSYAAALVVVGRRLRGHGLTTLAAAVIGSAAVCAAFAFEQPATGLAFVNPRFGAVAMVVGLGLLVARELRREVATADLGWPIASAALSLLGVVLGIEAYQQFPAAAQMALSIVWAGYAAALVVAGFTLDARGLRLAGLGLLGVTAIKLPLLDLGAVDQLYRVASFLVDGALMIGVSYVYHHVDARYAKR